MRAFDPGDERVALVVKINNSRRAPEELASLKTILSDYRNVRFIEESLPRAGVDELIRGCDALVSLHRAEGFGLVLAEAMSFGKPVVATGYSANTEFMDPSNSCPVNYKLVELDRDYGHYKAGGQHWADPDLGHAASLMRRLVEDPDYRESIGKNARERILRDFSSEASGAIIASRLREWDCGIENRFRSAGIQESHLIWLIGDKGMLGTELSHLLASQGLEFFGTDRDCDITEPEALRAGADGRKIDWIVNCSAYTAVDKAEAEEDLARRINARGALNIAREAEELGARLVHISTDYVFDGKASSPYLEDDPIAPTGAYGRTKAEGEALVRSSCPRHFILRTAWLYGRHGKNFVYTMLKIMAEKGEVAVVADQRGSPTWTRDLAGAIVTIIQSGSEAYGTYHYTEPRGDDLVRLRPGNPPPGPLPRHPCANPTLRPLTSDEFPSKVKRPSYSVLSKDKIRKNLDIEPPAWQDSLENFIAELTSEGDSASR